MRLLIEVELDEKKATRCVIRHGQFMSTGYLRSWRVGLKEGDIHEFDLSIDQVAPVDPREEADLLAKELCGAPLALIEREAH